MLVFLIYLLGLVRPIQKRSLLPRKVCLSGSYLFKAKLLNEQFIMVAEKYFEAFYEVVARSLFFSVEPSNNTHFYVDVILNIMLSAIDNQ